MRILFVASQASEFSGLLRYARDVQRADVAVDWCRTAMLADNHVMLAANGVGAGRAGSAVEAAMSFGPEAVVSIGFCGALRDEMKVADVVVGTFVRPQMRGLPEPQAGRPHHKGRIFSSDRVCQTKEEKRSLGSVADAVEMELGGVVLEAERRGLPVYCVKSVTDLAGEDMENDFNAALRADGHFDTMLILRRSLRHPAVRLPELLRLGMRCVRAARALGAFLADCRF
jgi:nucleoside phosphorylase